MSELIKINFIETLAALGEELQNPSAELLQIINQEKQFNAWFTPENVLQAVQAIGKMLNRNDLEKWLSKNTDTVFTGKKVGLVLAGNIPIVGFHDVLCVLASGHFAMIKASANDSRLITYILKRLVSLEPEFENRYEFTERLANFDAVMATGSNNTSRYFEYYFGKVPNIIRKNRNSLALISGDESEEELQKLGHDIFDYLDATQKLNAQKEAIQCVVSNFNLDANVSVVGFGQSQQPKLWDYADGVNTMAFLQQI
ncbi:MAG: hypothetical protein EOP42_18685 [Sphingobacteriaceae bacterium]|nr:MAG: hypothetical protein EOP42_18685 [Sphingobacteriaceae bacterium]